MREWPASTTGGMWEVWFSESLSSVWLMRTSNSLIGCVRILVMTVNVQSQKIKLQKKKQRKERCSINSSSWALTLEGEGKHPLVLPKYTSPHKDGNKICILQRCKEMMKTRAWQFKPSLNKKIGENRCNVFCTINFHYEPKCQWTLPINTRNISWI